MTDFFTARDGKSLFFSWNKPSETQGKDWLSTPSTYTAVEIQLDWAEQRVLETTLFPLGLLKFQFHYLRPAGDHFLLLGARCAYRENGPEQKRLDRQPGPELCCPVSAWGMAFKTVWVKKRWHYHYQLL